MFDRRVAFTQVVRDHTSVVVEQGLHMIQAVPNVSANTPREIIGRSPDVIEIARSLEESRQFFKTVREHACGHPG